MSGYTTNHKPWCLYTGRLTNKN